jgi:hypothetical protein
MAAIGSGGVDATVPHLLAWIRDKAYVHPAWVVTTLNAIDINERNEAFRRITLQSNTPHNRIPLRKAASAVRRKVRNRTYVRARRPTATTLKTRAAGHGCNSVKSHRTTQTPTTAVFIHGLTH